MYNIFTSSFNPLAVHCFKVTIFVRVSEKTCQWTSTLTKCFERLVVRPKIIHSNTTLRSNGDVINIRSRLMHLETPDPWVWILFVDFSCPFSIILLYRTVLKLYSLGVCYHLWGWLTNRPSIVHQTGVLVSSVLRYSTGMCAEEPWLKSYHSQQRLNFFLRSLVKVYRHLKN